MIGTDISPIQPNFIPPNLRFEIEDCTSEWTFSPGIFDFVHMRYLVGSIIDWTALYREAYRALQPGGWLESVEGSPHLVSDDGTIPDESPIAQWGKFFEEGGKKMGRSFMVVQDGTQRKAMEEAGFVDIQEWDFKVSFRDTGTVPLIGTKAANNTRTRHPLALGLVIRDSRK